MRPLVSLFLLCCVFAAQAEDKAWPLYSGSSYIPEQALNYLAKPPPQQ